MGDEYDCIQDKYKGPADLLQDAKHLLSTLEPVDGPRILCFLGSMTTERYSALKDFIRLRRKIEDPRFEITQAMLHMGDIDTSVLPDPREVRENTMRSLLARGETVKSTEITRLNDDVTRKCIMYDVMVNKGALSQNVLDPERVEKFE